MSEKAYGRRLAEEVGLTPELRAALAAAATKLAGRSFRTVGSLAKTLRAEIWNPWRYEGSAAYVAEAIKRTLGDAAMLRQIGVTHLHRPAWYDKVLGRKAATMQLEARPTTPELEAHLNAVLETEPVATEEAND